MIAKSKTNALFGQDLAPGPVVRIYPAAEYAGPGISEKGSLGSGGPFLFGPAELFPAPLNRVFRHPVLASVEPIPYRTCLIGHV